MADAGGVSTPSGSGPELVVCLGAAPADRPGALSLTCTSLGGTTVAVLEVDLSQLVQGLVGLLSERLEPLLARSSDWTQRLRLAYPDGSALPEPIDPSLTVEELIRSDAWRKAEARPREETDLPSPAGTPTRLSRQRTDSKGKLETNLKRLQEAKNLPLTAKAEAKSQLGKSAFDLAPLDKGSPAKPSASGRGGEAGSPAGAGAPGTAAPATASTGPSSAGPRPAGQRGSAADPASREAGGRVVLVSSIDGAHPGDNVIDGTEATYWMSTGLYPQEILVELGRPSRVSGVRLSATNVRGVRIEGCSENAAVQFETLAADEMEAAAGCMQRKELRCKQQAAPTRFVKTMILSGWHDFCSIHRITVVE